MNDFIIQLQAALDEAKSKENIKGNIDDLQKQLNDVKVKIGLDIQVDSKEIQKLADNIGDLINKKIVISNIEFNDSSITQEGEKTGQQIGNAINQGIQKTTKKTNDSVKSFLDLKNFSELHKSINDIKVDSSSIKEYKKILDDVKNTYSEFGQVKITNEVFDEGILTKFKVNIEQVNGDLKETKSFIMSLNDDGDTFVFDGIIKGAESVVQHLDKSKNAINQTADAINELRNKSRLEDISKSLDNGQGVSKYQNQIQALENAFEKYGYSADEAKEKTKSLQDTLDSMHGLSGQELIDQADKLEQGLKEVKISAEAARLAYDKFEQPASDSKIANTILSINKFLQSNSRITDDAREKLKGYVNELSNLGATENKLKAINNDFKKIQSAMSVLDRLGKSFGDQIREVGRNVISYVSVASLFGELAQQLRKMPQAVYEVDTAMTNLYKVTDETQKKYDEFLNSASTSARNLGRSVSSLVEQTANWAKLGFDIDEAQKLAETSSVYANVGEVDDETAISDIVTAIKAFNIEASDSITIVDSLNKLGNEFATDAKSLGEGLRNSASSMSVAGNDINQTLAILTGAGEITQNVGELSNGLRVVSMRLRGMKGELQNIGEEYEDIESISKIQTQIYNLTKGKVNIFKDDGSFKSTYDQLKEISEIYFDLSDPDRADLTEIMFGKNRANQGIAILQAFKSGQIQKAYEASSNAAGSAMQEQERWLGSLEADFASLYRKYATRTYLIAGNA